MLIGRFDAWGSEYKFEYENGKFITNKHCVMDFSSMLSDPWTNPIYCIRDNTDKRMMLHIDDERFEWICEYKTFGYDAAVTEVYGYGRTPEEALKQCNEHLSMLISLYDRACESEQ